MTSNVRCFVDCSETVCTGINTGIQRTVRNIIIRHTLISKIHDISVIPVIALNGKFYKYNVESDRRVFTPLLSKVLGSIRDLLDKICYRKKKITDDSFSAFSSVLVTANASMEVEAKTTEASGNNSVHLHIIDFCRKILPLFFLCSLYLDNALKSSKEVDIGSDDIIFYSDSFWHRCTYLSLRRYHAIKILLLYDIIPISRPELCDIVHLTAFKQNLVGVIANIDGIISISKSEMVNIRSFIATNGYAKVKLFDYFHLGANFNATMPVSVSGNTSMHKAFQDQKTFVMVGTIEPRKNHAFVLDAFEMYWQQGGESSLCIIGKVSNLSSDLKLRIDNHKQKDLRLYCFDNVNDAGLAYCYKNCIGVIFASLAEGFGLPLVEAMWYGRPVLASEIPVFREIGGDYPIYFPLNDLTVLVQCLYNFTHGAYKDPIPKKWLSWDESVNDLFGKILTMASTARQSK